MPVCLHCEGWGCEHCKLARAARAGGEQGFTEVELELHAARKRIVELEAATLVLGAAVNARVTERDEWKAKAEAAERNSMLQWNIGIRRTETAERERDEAAAQVERLREALDSIMQLNCDAHSPHDCADDCIGAASENIANAALSEPIAPWLAERDRALAMRVAELAYMRGYSDGHPDECFPTNKPIAAIVDAALKVKP